jgi:hypothetical protein
MAAIMSRYVGPGSESEVQDYGSLDPDTKEILTDPQHCLGGEVSSYMIKCTNNVPPAACRILVRQVVSVCRTTGSINKDDLT